MKQKKYKYFKTLGESIRLVFKNPKVLIPLILSIVIAVILAPFMLKIQYMFVTPAAMYQNLVLLILFYILMLVWWIIVYGWTFALVKQLVNKKEPDLVKSLKRSFSFGLRNLAIGILAVIFLLILYAVIAILVSLIALIPILGTIIAVIFGLVFVVYVVLYLTAVLHTMPVLIIEDKGVIETIKITLRFYLKKKLYSLNIAIISFLSILLLSLPAMAYQFKIMLPMVMESYPMVYSYTQLMILNVLYLIPTVFCIALLVYYCLSYNIKKATIK